MASVSGKVITRETTPDGIFARVQLNGKCPKEGTTVKLKWGKIRSIDQNSLYFVFLTWLVDEAGMKEIGYQTKDELHSALKGHFLTKKVTGPGGLVMLRVGSTANLDALDFMDYIENCDKLMNEFFNISTAPFWKDYADFYGKH